MRRAWLSVAIVAAAVPASAFQSLRVSDVLRPEQLNVPRALSEAPAPDVPGPVVGLRAPDVVDDPNADVEEISHLEPGIAIQGTREDVLRGTSKAFGILGSARARARGSWPAVFSRVSASLARDTVKWPNPGYDFRVCQGTTLAFVMRNDPSAIHLCQYALRILGERGMAQTLVHEGAHTDGYWDECDATRVEVNSMRLSGAGIDYVNGYWRRCGID